MIETSAPSETSGYSMSVMDAIYMRHSVRDYNAKKVSPAVIHALLYAAVQAPTALNKEPWVFAVVQDKKMLNRLSEEVKNTIMKEGHMSDLQFAKYYEEQSGNPEFDIFYNAATLVIIYGKPAAFIEADCWLAAENLMLSAYAANLGSCVIGLAISVLNTPHWKKRLDIPNELVAYVPIILGYHAGGRGVTRRKAPEIVCWKGHS